MKLGTEPNPVRLCLYENDNGIALCVVDENGQKLPNGNLLVLDEDGYLRLRSGINTGLGLPLGERGQLVLR